MRPKTVRPRKLERLHRRLVTFASLFFGLALILFLAVVVRYTVFDAVREQRVNAVNFVSTVDDFLVGSQNLLGFMSAVIEETGNYPTEDLLASLRAGFPQFGDFVFIDSDATIRWESSASQDRAGFDVSRTPYFIAARDNGRYAGTSFNVERGLVTVLFAEAIQIEGAFGGCIAVELNLQKVAALVSAPPDEFGLLDASGTVIFHTHPSWAQERRNYGTLSLVSRAFREGSVSGLIRLDGLTQVGSAVRLENGWLGLIHVPLRSLLFPDLWVVIFAAVPLLIASLLFNRYIRSSVSRISRPVIALASRLDDLTEGRDVGEAVVSGLGYREIDDLVARFSLMARTVRQRDLELRKAVETLRGELGEKEVLLKEIHHRVKNNLQIISSLLHLQIEKTPDSIGAAALEDSRARIHAMAMIHEKLYRSETLQRIDAGDLVSSLARDIMQSTSSNVGIEVDVDLEPLWMEIEQAIPFGLIVVEVVTNSLKHAFNGSEEGRISAQLHRSEIGYTLVIRDNGPGYREDPIKLAEKTESLGLKLITSLASQLDAEFRMYNDGGAVFELSVPWTTD